MKLLLHSKKEDKFQKLIDSVQYCSLCHRLGVRQKVLSYNNGNIYSNILFIAEAPGRLGADRTLIPLFGDQAGRNFQKLLDSVGWEREDVFITNAVLCNPRDEAGTNDTPLKKEIESCSIYLNMIIEIIDPEYIITLGQKALESLKYIENHNVELRTDVRRFIPWYDRLLIPLYHTSPRAMIHRNYFNQLSDFYYINKSIKKKAERKTKIGLNKRLLTYSDYKLSKLHEIVVYLINKLGKVYKFKLAKLIYLIDIESIKAYNKILSESYYVRLYDGPLPTNFEKVIEYMKGNELFLQYKNRLPILCGTGLQRFDIKLKHDEISLIDQILDKYSSYSNSRLKTIAYLTEPMRRILKKEKDGIPMYGKPVFEPLDFEKKETK